MKSTYSPSHGTATLSVEIPHEMLQSEIDRFTPLAELLALLVEHEPFSWTATAQLGDAGFVTITYNLDPCKLPVAVRDELLLVASRLINWSHA